MSHFAAKLEHFAKVDLNEPQKFAHYSTDELARFLSSDWQNGVLVYGVDGSIRAIWSENQAAPYLVDMLPIGGSKWESDEAVKALEYVECQANIAREQLHQWRHGD